MMDERDVTCGELLYKGKIEQAITLIGKLSENERTSYLSHLRAFVNKQSHDQALQV